MNITYKKMPRGWLFWHQWIGLVACMGMVLWGLSGATHPLMSRLQPVPAQFKPPLLPVDLSQSVALPALLQQHGITQFQHISLCHLEAQAYYRIALPHGAPRFFSLHTGEERMQAESALAIQLAGYYTARSAHTIQSARPVSKFEPDYHPVNRLLPVWKVRYAGEGNVRAYVDTEQSRLATLVDDRRAFLTQVFQFGHNWSFLQGCSTLQLVVATLVLSLVVASAFTGITLYVRQRKTAPYRLKRWRLQWWHREGGLWVSLVLLLLASSGLYHLWVSDAQQRRPALSTRFAADSRALSAEAWTQLATGSVRKLDIYGRGATLFWQIIPAISGSQGLPAAQVAAQHQHHVEKPSVAVMPVLWMSDPHQVKALTHETYAAAWLRLLAGRSASALQSVTWVTAFANEYGFIFKRLPVLKLQTSASDGERWYVEPATGHLAASINATDGLEGFVFAYVHKWSFQSLNKDLRDGLAIVAALAISLTGLLGAYLFIRKRM